MAQHNLLGQQGEHLAQEYLRKKHYTLLHTNWRHGNIEVDIIAKKGKEIVFIEVKTRTSDCLAQPEDAIDLRRKQRLTQAANIYLQQYHTNLTPRFDIIAILLPAPTAQAQIHHIEDAFPPIARYY